MDPNTGAGTDGSSAVALDPVCGMKVERALAAGAEEFHGRTYFFCSASCKQTFSADAAHYAAPRSDPSNDEARHRHRRR